MALISVRSRSLAWCLAVTVAAAAGVCGAASTSQETASSTQPLASLVVSGGLCSSDVCRSEVQVMRSGHWTRSGGGPTPTPGPGVHSEGQLTSAELSVLEAAVDQTALGKAASNTEVCATASDGMELVISWVSAERRHVVSSCREIVPVTDPLVAALEALLHA